MLYLNENTHTSVSTVQKIEDLVTYLRSKFVNIKGKYTHLKQTTSVCSFVYLFVDLFSMSVPCPSVLLVFTAHDQLGIMGYINIVLTTECLCWQFWNDLFLFSQTLSSLLCYCTLIYAHKRRAHYQCVFLRSSSHATHRANTVRV